MRGPGAYDHLNDDTPVRISSPDGSVQVDADMERVVRAVMASNYGVHRFLSMLARERAKSPYHEEQSLAPVLNQWLRDGGL